MFKTVNNGILPQAQTEFSVGYDVCANEDITLWMTDTKLIPLGIAIDQDFINKKTDPKWFKSKFFFALYIRSSLALKGLSLQNGTGIIDMDYPNEIKMMLHYNFKNDGGKPIEIKKGDRVGQILLLPHAGITELDGDYRLGSNRIAGFGSTK